MGGSKEQLLNPINECVVCHPRHITHSLFFAPNTMHTAQVGLRVLIYTYSSHAVLEVCDANSIKWNTSSLGMLMISH